MAAFGALLHLTALPGQRDDLVHVLGNYLKTLEEGEPGTTLITVALDPNDEDTVWMWEEFVRRGGRAGALRPRFLPGAAARAGRPARRAGAVRPMAPVARHVRGSVPAE